MDKSIQITDEFLKKRPLSATSSKKFGGQEGSPKQYIHYLFEKKDDPEDFVIGRATEQLIYQEFDPRFKFEKAFQMYNKFPRRSAADKERWSKMVEEARENKITLINEVEFAEARNMADTALQTDETRYYLDRIARDKDGQLMIQNKLKWTDKKRNLPVIGYIDFMAEIEGTYIIIDIKTDKDGGPDSFKRNAKYLDYIIQVGAYLTGYHKTRFIFPEFMFMVIDKSDPYDAIMMHCDSDYCQRAKDEFDHILTSFRYCMDNNLFHMGRSFWLADGMNYFSMPFDRFMKLKSVID